MTVTERLLGADEKAYAVLRTESDNCSSYYQTKTKTHFIERFTDGSGREKSTLLSETETDVDANHNDPKMPPPVTTRVLTRDDSLSLTEALLRYPISEAKAWDAIQLAHLRVHPSSGISLDNRVEVASGTQIDALFGSPGERKVSGAFEQGSCLFLLLEMEMPEGGPETRVLGLDKYLSDQVNAHLKREDIYLCAGNFGSREEALERVEFWKTDRKTHVASTTWEIWSRRLPTDKIDHVLVLARTREMLGGWSKRIEEETGIRFEAISSDGFIERTRVP